MRSLSSQVAVEGRYVSWEERRAIQAVLIALREEKEGGRKGLCG